jgi:hypothetical protein
MHNMLALKASLQKAISDALQKFGSTWNRPGAKEHACLHVNND